MLLAAVLAVGYPSADGSGSREARRATEAGDAKCAPAKISDPSQRHIVRRGKVVVRVPRCGRSGRLRLSVSLAKAGGGGAVAITKPARVKPRKAGPKRVHLSLQRGAAKRVKRCAVRKLTAKARFGDRGATRRSRRYLLLDRQRCKPSPPNVLLIITDDQRLGGTMPAMKQTRREFAERGTKFTRAFVSTPLCCPSRASIFSGKFAHNHGIRSNDGTGFDAAQTWQAELHQAGYFTGLFGKYLNEVSAARAPIFDRRAPIRPNDPRDPDLIAAHARNFLSQAERSDPRPWALVLASNGPHGPYNAVPANPKPLPEWRPPSSLGEDLSDKNPVVAAEAGRYAGMGRGRSFHDGQLLELKRLDHAIGQVMRMVEGLGERENTLAIFISDNGFMWGEHGLYTKWWPYLGSVRVPLYMSWPGRIADRESDGRLAMNLDLAPTILDAAGRKPGYPIDGRSLLDPGKRSWIFLEGARDRRGIVPGWSAMFDGKRHYIQWADGFVEDYSLESDPDEMRASNVPDPEAAQRLAEASTCSGSACP